tara:strand:- start:354 stop:470 length:117 start_codon:yes stop_codon:yes gene_type:complete
MKPSHRKSGTKLRQRTKPQHQETRTKSSHRGSGTKLPH